MNPKDKDFKKLQDLWYAKLEKSGFKDIEQDEQYFKSSPDIFRAKPDKVWIESKIEYYRLAGQMLHDYTFQSNLEKIVWELHSDGKSLDKIIDILKDRKIKTYRWQAQQIIERLAEVMVSSCR